MTVLSRNFMRAGEYSYRLHTMPVAAIPGTVNMRITSVWKGAKKPLEEQCKLNLTLNREELKTLIEGLQAALAQGRQE